MTGVCDVVMCDGFTENVFLKTTEGMGKQILSSRKEVYSENLITKLSYSLVRIKFEKSRRDLIRRSMEAHRSSEYPNRSFDLWLML